MAPIENPDCPTCEVVMERIDRQWCCPCCAKCYPIGSKRIERRQRTDLHGVEMDDDG